LIAGCVFPSILENSVLCSVHDVSWPLSLSVGCAGGYSPDECEPDADLGKAVTPGFRNITADTRVYG
jgi:hypothetical protein